MKPKIALVLALALPAPFFSGCPKPAWTPAPPTVAPAVVFDRDTMAKVARRDIEDAVETTGFVESVNAPFDVRPEIGGRITRLFVDTGTPVKRGQKLLELDDALPKAELEEVSRNEQLARLELDRAERDERRQESLFTQGFSTDKARLDAKTEADFARLKLQLASAGVDKARANLAKTVVTAPFDGFVSDLGVSVDQVISGNSTLLMRVYDFSKLRVVAKLNEFDAARMTIGKAAVITFDSLPDTGAPGTIGYISPFATSEQNLRVFTVKIDFSPKDAPARPGVSANVRIVTRRAPGAVAIPVSALFIDGPDRHVYVQTKDGTFVKRAVTPGVNDSGFVEIRSGLAEGEIVSLVRPSGK